MPDLIDHQTIPNVRVRAARPWIQVSLSKWAFLRHPSPPAVLSRSINRPNWNGNETGF
jgi:hypothetical protein